MMKKADSKKDSKKHGKVEGDIESLKAEEKINELEILKQSLDEKKKESGDYYEQLLRLKAEFENYRKRVERESRELAKYGKAEVIAGMFPVLDSFEKAISTVEKSSDVKSVIEGIKLIYKHMMDVLKKEGLKKIESAGKKFDPNLHHAVMTREGRKDEDNKIVEEIQAGYTLADRVIRPAMVVVAKHEETKKRNNEGEEKK